MIPNCLTLLRLILTLPIIFCLARADYFAALLLFIFASVTDVLDGFLARRFQWSSRLGAQLDPIADKCLLVSLYLTLYYLDYISLVLVTVVVGRDVLILAGSMFYRYRFGPFHVQPSRMGKLCTLCQVLLVWALLMELALSGWVVPSHWLPYSVEFLSISVLLVTLFSGIQYLYLWGSKLLERQARSHHE